jgi:hypothetical protein
VIISGFARAGIEVVGMPKIADAADPKSGMEAR